MARYDGELKAAHEVSVAGVFGVDRLPGTDERVRKEAIACYLSASDGWQDALTLLRGAFAPEEQQRGKV